MDNRSEYERGYRDGYRDGVKDLAQHWPKPQKESPPEYLSNGPSCPKCGLKTERVMGYVCNVNNCPMFPRATWGDPEWRKDHDRSKY